ncbi:hypothetical protein roselon_01214 [Roseibacterium elongatum DSM 19469]|uniref:HPt domain-containing protein n=1 Tax=Roseicyclus elongatus DSM 19469 TaxID=1294273 RepID=W8SM40_9RHOB|nr:hypothetical protein [Roseibacterium elongatum]AHM03605.1 hypothetical protein roselon_01214 [Roseibacterium elongatum DSM 19469]
MKPFVRELRPEEPARFNPDKLEDLCLRIGEHRAEAEVAKALERISLALRELADSCGAPDRLRAATTTLMQDAEFIGMATLARVARNALDAMDTGNAVTLAATLARLERVGDRSIHAVWDLEDLSG